MLFNKQKSQLGIDIGTSNIKLVELHAIDGRFDLETYGIADMSYSLASKDSGHAIEQTAKILKELMRRAQVSTNKAVASLPNNAVFTSVIELPRIPENELKKAVEFEAKKYVPLPLEEVALSYSGLEDYHDKVIGSNSSKSVKEDNGKQKILLTAVPTVVIDNYVKMFKVAGVEPQALEIEALALIRSVVHDDQNSMLLVDIGAKTTSINLVDSGYLRLSKSLNLGGDTITASLSQSLSVNFARAEQFKKDFGLTAAGADMPQVVRPILDMVKNEVNQLINLFESRGSKINKLLFSGAGSKLPGLSDYFGTLGKPIQMANPLEKITYSSNLKPVVDPLGLNLAIAIGLAMRS